MKNMINALLVLSVSLVAASASAQQSINPGDFSSNAVRVTLEDQLGKYFVGPIGSELKTLGVVVDVGNAGDYSTDCPGQVDILGGNATWPSHDYVEMTFVSPGTMLKSTTTAFGFYVGSLQAEVTLKAYDANGNLVGSVSTSPSSVNRNPAYPVGDFLGIRYAGGIHRVTIENGASNDLFVVGDFYVSHNYPQCIFGTDFMFEPPASVCL